MGGARRRDGGRTGRVLSGAAVAVGLVLFLGGFLWAALAYRPYTVPTDSMTPTIARGARVLAERVDGAEVHRGDVVVFRNEVWGDVPMIKRVVGVGGDTVACCDRRGRITVNGRPVEEPYLQGAGPASPTGFSATVPGDRLFLLGDHRAGSADSRSHLTEDQGAVPRGAVSARVEAVAWPANAWGMLGRPGSFDALPGGTSRPGPLKWLVASVVAGAALVLGGAAYGPLARLLTRRQGRQGGAVVPHG
ncbi:signal peptidase I [Streptomyces sp. AV19]|uniref:signal peptidase I n=1 Tax=Streptomyces sp. AV19 TaxID=2793068 RepID=UPI0018FF0F13|nr:signal peptidase I [Streptomyces sp. AV19]MBH1934000.1 signal peptidase I [Streptomyces sp. AV19]MDG4535515.1 signal peptidase I [Streptomyces sp. AV19]